MRSGIRRISSFLILAVMLFGTIEAFAQMPNELTPDELQSFLEKVREQNGNTGNLNSGNTIEATLTRAFNGHVNGEQFGSAIASGDLNGDGYVDFLIGASSYQSTTGRAYIYFGGASFNDNADIVLQGEAVGNAFGYTVAIPGDLNGDGYSDAVVGAYAYSGSIGKVYIYFGGTFMDNNVDATLQGSNANEYFGCSIAGAGDVNGDAYPDLLIGANNVAGHGAAYIYYGGNGFDIYPDITLSGNSNSFFASTVGTAGDVNGDGYSDVLIGEWTYSANSGRVFVFYGGASMNTDADVTLYGGGDGGRFGRSFTGGRDINGDGFDDVVISSYASNNYAGRVDVFYGSANMDATNDVVIFGSDALADFGYAVTLADANGDGFADIIVGASRNTGKAFLFLGGLHMDAAPDGYMLGESPNSYFGVSAATATDMDGDGIEEYLVGATGFNSLRGRVYLYKNSYSGTDTPDFVLRGLGTGHWFGLSVACAGDVNGDGYQDILVGAPGYSNSRGRAYLYFGGQVLDTIPELIFEGQASYDRFGNAVASAGDLNGDGYFDIVIGAYMNDAGGNSAGSAYVYFGGVGMDAVADLTMIGEGDNAILGFAVAGAGDINGDGFDDLLIGAPGTTVNDSVSAGKQYLYFGGTVMDNTPDLEVSGYHRYDNRGISVAGAGDLNGDGFDDYIVGTYRRKNDNYESTGMVSVYYGNASAFWSFEELYGTVNSGFGISIASAGDVNADGLKDIVIGELRKASIFKGSANKQIQLFVSTDRWSTNNISVLAQDVSAAGDVNGDGYGDVLIGSGITSLCVVLFGGVEMDSIPDVIMRGTNTNEYFGMSVAPLGDLNRDGLDDFFVGGYNNTRYYSGGGAASIYLSTLPSVHPRISSVADIPRDQGGKVNISFHRSGYELAGNGKITGYKIERGINSAGGLAWSALATIGTGNNVRYVHEATTQSDSTPFYYRVTALTANANEYWRSNIMSGMSIDNLAPGTVKNLSIGSQGSNNRLSWKLNSEPDMRQYLIYRSNSNSINTSTAEVYATTTDSVFTDNSPLLGESYYFVSAQDIHQNQSNPVGITSPNAAINLTLFLEGSYDAITDQQTPDSIRVDLCAASAPYNRIDSAVAVVNASGNASVKFFNAVNNTYYVVVTHRNSISTWSKAGGETISKGSTLNYDFSTEASSAYGSNLRQKGSRWCLYSGDVNQDGIVDFSDLTMIDNDAYQFGTGYLVTDLSGDSFVDFTDLAIADNNSYNYIQELRPGGMYKTGVGRGILRTKSLPKEFTVSDNYPNPFNPSTNINYSLPKDANVHIEIYNVQGEKVMTVYSGEQKAGFYSVHISLLDKASGMYVLRFTAGDYVQTKKILLTK